MDQKIINLYDAYTHSKMGRKSFLEKLAILAGSTAMALTILPLLENNYAAASPINYADVESKEVSFEGVDGKVKAILAKPTGAKNLGGVVVIHENRGLNPHIVDVTKKLASDGYLALGIDALSVFGGTPEDEDKGRDLIGKLNAQNNLQNYLKGLAYLRQHPDCNGKTGCIGFCWGGGLANKLAANDPKLNASVAYYGAQISAAEVANVKASMMMHYGGLDERINAGIPAFEEALKANQIDYKIYIYEGVNHAFNNNTSPTRYNEVAANLAWKRTLELFANKIR